MVQISFVFSSVLKFTIVKRLKYIAVTRNIVLKIKKNKTFHNRNYSTITATHNAKSY